MKQLCGILIVISCSFLAACADNKSKLEKLLGVDIPSGAGSDCQLYLDRRPDYNYVELSARFQADASTWETFASSLGLAPNSFALPYQKIPKEIASWWNVPSSELQLTKGQLVNDRGVLHALWWENHIYIEFAGHPPAKVD